MKTKANTKVVKKRKVPVSYTDAKTRAAFYACGLLATDKRFNRSVYLILQDGTTKFIPNAFVLMDKKWLYLFSEHAGFQVYDLTDIFRCTPLTQSVVGEMR